MSASAQSQTRSAGMSYQELISQDLVPPAPSLTLESPYEGDLVTVPITRYNSREFHELEMERLWPKVWQMACREEEIPSVGDYIVYEIGRYSILVVRTKEGIKAHHNVCRHRGRKLCDGTDPSHAASFICPFHGFSWNIDGSLRGVTSDWDFPHIDKDNFDLKSVQVGFWGGWVFINMDENCQSFEEFIGDLPAHFAIWQPEDRYLEAHVAKVMKCNWKLCQEAFMEAFHVITTHPQILESIGDENSQYDAWGNFSRAITPSGTPSPHLRSDPTQQQQFESTIMRKLDDPEVPALPDGLTARAALAEGAIAGMREIVGPDRPLGHADMLDSIYYTLFPNFHPWGGYNRIVYRFRPWQNRHDRCLMECYYWAPFKDGERPAPAPMHFLDEDQDWTEAPELGMLAKVFQQDTFNLPQVQAGLEAGVYDEVVLARYQETKLRHFHTLLNEWIA